MPTIPLLPLPEGLEITAISLTDQGLLVRVVSTRMSCPCPVCGTSSEAVHSFYRRHPQELPCAGQRVRFLLSVHTFFCRHPTCPRKVFTERLQPNSRLTTRPRSLIQAIGLAFNRQGGARLSEQCGSQRRGDKQWSSRFASVGEVYESLNKTVDTISEYVTKDGPVIFTLSPVPLKYTASALGIREANNRSKSTLAIALGELVTSRSDVEYYPSYEMIQALAEQPGSKVWQARKRAGYRSYCAYVLSVAW